MAVVRHDDPTTAAHSNGHGREPGELSPAEIEAARRLNYERARIRIELDNERRQPPQEQRRDHWWRNIHWSDVVIRELVAVILTGAVISAVLYAADSRRARQAQQLEDKRQTETQRLENIRFVRQIVTSSPDGPKPFARLDLRGASLAGLHLTDANLTEADLTDADLTDADLRDADLTKADLTKADLTEADLTDANLSGADLTGAGLVGAQATDTHLDCTNLSGALLAGADLVGADLTLADLTDAILFEANLTDANLSGADLTGANLRGVGWSPKHPPRWPERFSPLPEAAPPTNGYCRSGRGAPPPATRYLPGGSGSGVGSGSATTSSGVGYSPGYSRGSTPTRPARSSTAENSDSPRPLDVSRSAGPADP